MAGKKGSKWVHRMLSKDIENMVGECQNCGPVKLVKMGSKYLCHSSQSRWRNRKGYRRHLRDVCERCGFVPVDQCQLDIHHRDDDHNNNDPGNLETICANCHRLEKPTGSSCVWSHHA